MTSPADARYRNHFDHRCVPGLSVSRSLLSLVGFLLGAAGGGRIQTVLAGDNRRKWLLSVGVVETALIRAAALASFGFDIDAAAPADRLYAMIVLTAITMGLRSATAGALLLRYSLALPSITAAACVLGTSAAYALASSNESG